MASWQITATTIYCDTVDDEATVIVYKDGTIKCTGYNRYFHPDHETDKFMKRRGKVLHRILKCDGLECQRVTAYRDNLMAENGIG